MVNPGICVACMRTSAARMCRVQYDTTDDLDLHGCGLGTSGGELIEAIIGHFDEVVYRHSNVTVAGRRGLREDR